MKTLELIAFIFGLSFVYWLFWYRPIKCSKVNMEVDIKKIEQKLLNEIQEDITATKRDNCK